MSMNFKCELCSDTFVEKVYLEEHMIKNHSSHENNVSTLLLKTSQYKFTCSHCDYGCNTSKALKMHTTRVHYSNSTISPQLDKLFVMANPSPNPMATVPPNPDPLCPPSKKLSHHNSSVKIVGNCS